MAHNQEKNSSIAKIFHYLLRRNGDVDEVLVMLLMQHNIACPVM
jgi:hypothetical protein